MYNYGYIPTVLQHDNLFFLEDGSVDMEDILEVQKIAYKLLVEVDRICKKYEIKYFLWAGTLLGTIRHKDFIPWDDDVDIVMFRDDYKRFLEVAQYELAEGMFLQTNETDVNYPLLFAKVRDRNSAFVERKLKDIPMNHGVYIDIFPLDYVSDNNILRSSTIIIFYILYFVYWSKLVVFSSVRFNNNNKLKRMITIIAALIFPVKASKIKSMHADICTKLNQNETGFVSILAFPVNLNNRRIFKKEWLDVSIKAEFNEGAFNIPAGYHDILTHFFGDYLKLPPEEKRFPHHQATFSTVESVEAFLNR
jgi:lipopolysaccharide cholinephosphotransferase